MQFFIGSFRVFLCPFVSFYYLLDLVSHKNQPLRPSLRSLVQIVGVNVCPLLELWEAMILSLMWDAGNSNELIPCSRHNSLSSLPGIVPMRISFIKVLVGFCSWTWGEKTPPNFLKFDWTSCLKVIMEFQFFRSVVLATVAEYCCWSKHKQIVVTNVLMVNSVQKL